MAHKQLTREQRYHLYNMLQTDLKQYQMANILGVDPSTISRELKLNSGTRGNYLKNAHYLTLARRKGKVKPRISVEHWARVDYWLQQEFSPEQVSDWLVTREDIYISHEWIYQHIKKDKRAGGTLHKHLRGKPSHRKKYGGTWNKNVLGERQTIEERPEFINQRKFYGDWEVDTMIGRQGGVVLVTLVERKSKLCLIGLSARKTAQAVKETMLKLLGTLSSFVHTLTYDNGPEFAEHREIDKELECQAYFARPYCSGDRGLNENTNGLIRQYLPKRSSFDDVKQSRIDFIMHRLNNRPRKTLNVRTPNEVFYKGTNIAFNS
ncbi:IS30 family transposase [uncultured Cocleimonas sp.]|uniref:IS30 family transposase n=1 Tax=uncultured Cocleimonas sp. TaxID=1051587 RepID=UPI0026207DD1|nr:IS30 family transposase [uncultured Cocleimonas sp.]